MLEKIGEEKSDGRGEREKERERETCGVVYVNAKRK